MSKSRGRRVSAALCAAVVTLALGGCSGRSTSGDGTAAGAGAATTSTAARATAETGNLCIGTDAHDRHAAAGFGCAVCHACPGELSFGSVTFPGGASTANGTMTSAGGTTTCSVGCHNPLGAEPHQVAWNAGPLQCTSCHTNVAIPDASLVLSSHLVSAGGVTATCESCHDHSQHTSGQTRLLNGDGTSTTSSCVECHSGQGHTLAGQTPPLLVGWGSIVGGDFHGPREGTCRFDRLDSSGQRTIGQGALDCPAGQPDFPNGLRITPRWWFQSGTSGPWAWTCDIETVDASGTRIGATRTDQPCPAGTILNSGCNNPQLPSQCYPTTRVTRGFGGEISAPYARGQGALPCASCHDSHSSTNAFLLASRVNGVAIPAATIDRAGVGAQALCNACHAGDRHEVCKTCHREIWSTDGEYSWFEGEPVDPVPDGAACFSCHGHEGIRFMAVSSPAYPDNHPYGGGDCSHCHDAWAPPPTEYARPSTYSPTVSGVTATTATVSWQTNEPSTSYVEYGVGTAGFVEGDDALVTAHSVLLTGLSPDTSYVWRVRTSDSFRNVTQTALQSFTTPGAEAVPRPDLAPVSVGITAGTFTTEVSLVWYPVVGPSATAVEYEVQLASDPELSYLVNGFMAGPGVPGLSVGDSGWVSGTPTTYGGNPALSYPATLTNIPQDECVDIVPNVYYWRVRARDQQGRVSDWSATGTFGAFAGDPWC